MDTYLPIHHLSNVFGRHLEEYSVLSFSFIYTINKVIYKINNKKKGINLCVHFIFYEIPRHGN